MTQLLKPRPYQDECIAEIFKAFDQGKQRAAVVLPTGSGKTVIFSHLADRWERRHESLIVILVHRDELITQTVAKLEAVSPSLHVGVVKAERNEIEDVHVIVASVQTLSKWARLDKLTGTRDVGLVIVDECHHATADGYMRILRALGCTNPGRGTKCVGFTATMVRSDSSSLGDVWPEVIFRRDILDMIPEYLCDVRGQIVTVDGLSLSEVAMSGGDYQISSLSEALLSSDAPGFVADAYGEHAKDMPGIVFTPTVETAMAFSEAMNDAGLNAAPVWGAQSIEDRRRTLKDFQDGKIQILVNCAVLTEGFDAPRAQCVVIARPTTSSGLYVQMVGRVLRPYPGKTQALVLDVVGASQEHRLASLVDLTSKRVLTMSPGESLTEAATRERNQANPALRGYAVSYLEVDLFHRSRANWLQTDMGIWFVTTKDHVYFVWPGTEPESYHVGWRPIKAPIIKGVHGWTHRNVDLETGKAWIEQEATELEFSTARNATWRRRDPSEKMVNFGQMMGVTITEGMKQGSLSDAISIRQVSQLLDKPLRKIRA
jgi:superfamily II DNA or RNA helicase